MYDLVSSSELLTVKIKSFTLLLFLLFVSCGSESEITTVETVEIPQELLQVNNTTTTTEVDLNKLGDEFLEYYFENKIEGFSKYGKIKSFWIDGKLSYAVNTPGATKPGEDYEIKEIK